MRVHHLNCGTMRPPTVRGPLVAHVLLVETGDGLVLVDTGFGLRCAAEPAARFGPSRHLIRPLFDPTEAALTQIRALGLDPADVRHILLTHADADHTGGLADFPDAQVHLTAAEALGTRERRTLLERNRYRPVQLAHGPHLVEHTPAQGESWRGFPGAQELTAIAPGIVLISLPGHTRGHAAYAVDAGSHWVLHVGDAFYDHRQLEPGGGAPRALTTMERLVAHDWAKVQGNHRRLAQLWTSPEPGLVLVNAHDPELLERARDAAVG